MVPLEAEQLIELEDAILDELFGVLTRKNADGTLERLLVLGLPRPLVTRSDGNILVVGAKENLVRHLIGIAGEMGISPRRLKFISYDEATNYPFDHLAYNDTWCAVLIGANPHSVRGRGDSSSIIAEMEKHREKYPETRRLWASNELKVTKTTFSEALGELIAEGLVIAA